MGILKHTGHTSEFCSELPWRRLKDLQASVMKPKTSGRAHKLLFDLKNVPYNSEKAEKNIQGLDPKVETFFFSILFHFLF